MKRRWWYGLAMLALTGPAQAQNLTGAWQGVETLPGDPRYWPVVLRLQGKPANLLGVLTEEVGGQPEVSVTFQMRGVASGTRLQLTHGPELNETGRTRGSYWCAGTIAFTYDAALEKLTGHATYRPDRDCTSGEFIFYRVRLKSAATVVAGAASLLRVSGRDVHWFADAELTQPLATGNTYGTRLSKTTTFYLTQGFYPSAGSPVVPITIQVTGTRPRPAPLPVPPVALATPALRVPADSVPPAPATVAALPAPAPAPVVLPTVLFQNRTTELLPTAGPALDQLAADLRAAPSLRLRIAGHTDRVGDSGKNQLLSEQRAEAIKNYLVRAGVAAARLSTVGYGDSRPRYPSPDLRNRRVEVEEVR